MISHEMNELLTRTGPGTETGAVMRHYWQPAALSDELAGPRPVVPVRLLGEDLVLFRDSDGQLGLIEVGRRTPVGTRDLTGMVNAVAGNQRFSASGGIRARGAVAVTSYSVT